MSDDESGSCLPRGGLCDKKGAPDEVQPLAHKNEDDRRNSLHDMKDPHDELGEWEEVGRSVELKVGEDGEPNTDKAVIPMEFGELASSYVQLPELKEIILNCFQNTLVRWWWDDVTEASPRTLCGGVFMGRSEEGMCLMLSLERKYHVIARTHILPSLPVDNLTKEQVLNLLKLCCEFSKVISDWGPKIVTWYEKKAYGRSGYSKLSYPITRIEPLELRRNGWIVKIEYSSRGWSYTAETELNHLSYELKPTATVEEDLVITQYETKIQKLESKNANLQREVRTTKTELRNTKDDRDNAWKSLKTLRKQRKHDQARKIGALQRQVDDLSQTIEENNRSHHDLVQRKEQHITALYSKLERGNTRVKSLQEQTHRLKQRNSELDTQQSRSLQHREEFDRLREEYEKECNKNSKLRDKYSRLKGSGVKIDSSLWKVDKTIQELNRIRMQVHSDATDIFEDDERFDGIIGEERQYEMLFEVFMFTYGHCSDKFGRLGEVMKLDDPRVYGPMMETLQENFELYLDLEEVKQEYLLWVDRNEKGFGPIEREYLVHDEVVSDYMSACATLCWVIVLTTSPRLELQPMDHRVQGGSIEYDPTKFILAPGRYLTGTKTAFVTQYLLPGIARSDTGKWVSDLARPWVDAKEERDARGLVDEMKHERSEVDGEYGAHHAYSDDEADNHEPGAHSAHHEQLEEETRSRSVEAYKSGSAGTGYCDHDEEEKLGETTHDTIGHALVDLDDETSECASHQDPRETHHTHTGRGVMGIENVEGTPKVASVDFSFGKRRYVYNNQEEIQKCVRHAKFAKARQLLLREFDFERTRFFLDCGCGSEIGNLPDCDPTGWIKCEACNVQCPRYKLRVVEASVS